MSDTSAIMNVCLCKRYKHVKRDVKMLNVRYPHILSSSFNVTAYSNRRSLHEFRFRVTEIPKIAAVLNFQNCKIRLRGYVCDKSTRFCIVPKIMSSPCNWIGLKLFFCICISSLSKIFWQIIEQFVANHGHLVRLKINDA